MYTVVHIGGRYLLTGPVIKIIGGIISAAISEIRSSVFGGGHAYDHTAAFCGKA